MGSLLSSGSVFARLDGAIFTTTPSGEIVNENVRYESKQEVFLDGGPGPNAPGTAAALPEGYYYFQVTNPSGKCLLSSIEPDSGVNGGSCYEDVKGKGGPKNSTTFNAEPLECRLIHFDGEDRISVVNQTYTTTVKYRGSLITVEEPCQHLLGSEYLGGSGGLTEGETVQLYPFANTPNSGGVYKAWVATEQSVIDACEGKGGVDNGATGEQCDGFFGFIPKFSKTDNFKVRLEDQDKPINFDVALRSFHDKNLNCQYDPNYAAPSLGDELIENWDFGVIDPLAMRNIYRTTDSEEFPTTFSVLEQETQVWTVDRFMWFAELKNVIPLNTPFSHFTTFADLRAYAPMHNDGTLYEEFVSALACQQQTTTDLIARNTREETDDGFTPSQYGVAQQGTKGVDPDPVLVVSFGQIGIADITVCKAFDIAQNGYDQSDPLISNWKMILTVPESVPLPDNINATDTPTLWNELVTIFGPDLGELKNRKVEKVTDETGCVDFIALVPNVKGDLAKYIIEEDIANQPDWHATTTTSIEFAVRSVLSYDQNNLPIIDGEVYDRSDNINSDTFIFNNVCRVIVDFDTKGYWHNKNGLSELTTADRDYVNTLDPYKVPSVYFSAGDEPFDGQFQDGTPVSAAFSGDEPIWSAGTWQSEVSQFLVDSNANSDINLHKEQLAQQLLAFIFNTRHRPSPNGLSNSATIEFKGEWLTAEQIISKAIEAWNSSNTTLIIEMAQILDSYNNNNALAVTPGSYEDCPTPIFTP
ncbi:hypothetical protein EGH82_16470 [Vibrio ponticus]|uniref:Uncharacterized protein n=1 Tax=Vibrio ponticus TaxID=265668 RepID=A0A3N3DWS3_9VIBR|nr:hypothetical protein EGH82_16470 [Vibrio ponticus]